MNPSMLVASQRYMRCLPRTKVGVEFVLRHNLPKAQIHRKNAWRLGTVFLKTFHSRNCSGFLSDCSGAAVFQYCGCPVIVVAASSVFPFLNPSSAKPSSRRQASTLVPKHSSSDRPFPELPARVHIH